MYVYIYMYIYIYIYTLSATIFSQELCWDPLSPLYVFLLLFRVCVVIGTSRDPLLGTLFS